MSLFAPVVGQASIIVVEEGALPRGVAYKGSGSGRGVTGSVGPARSRGGGQGDATGD